MDFLTVREAGELWGITARMATKDSVSRLRKILCFQRFQRISLKPYNHWRMPMILRNSNRDLFRRILKNGFETYA